jgi:hypothetical protein
LDERQWKRKLSVLQNNSVIIGCPVSGIPDPDISWLVNGQLMRPNEAVRGIILGADGRTVSGFLFMRLNVNIQTILQLVIDSAQIDHEGSYTCVGSVSF